MCSSSRTHETPSHFTCCSLHILYISQHREIDSTHVHTTTVSNTLTVSRSVQLDDWTAHKAEALMKQQAQHWCPKGLGSSQWLNLIKSNTTLVTFKDYIYFLNIHKIWLHCTHPDQYNSELRDGDGKEKMWQCPPCGWIYMYIYIYTHSPLCTK